MTLAEQIASDASTFFNEDEHAEAATLNGSPVTVVVEDEGTAEENNGKFEFVDVCFQAGDYATITHRTDTLVLRSVTWRYPLLQAADVYTKTVRFRDGARPIGWGR